MPPEMIRSIPQETPRDDAPRPRVLHCVGHLSRGGVEMGLFNLLTTPDAVRFEHHILVRTEQEEAFTEDFRKAGIRVIPCCGFRNPLQYARRLKRVVQQHGPYDILHVHGSSFSGLLTLALARWCGIRWRIVHSHNDVRPTMGEQTLLYRMYVRGVMAAYRALADSGFAASTLAAESMFGDDWQHDSRWELLYYGIDCGPFLRPKDTQLRHQLGVEDSAMVIGHVGRFHEQKNHAFLLDVVESAIALHPNVICLLIGDGPLREEIGGQVRSRGLDRHFRFVPDTKSVASYMTSAMDCFVFPSRYEGLGLVVVEAQAAGLPCVISDRIPREAIVDHSLVSVLPLESSPAVWAAEAFRSSYADRLSPLAAAVNRIENSRFNLNLCAAHLWNRYANFAQR